MTDKQNRLLNSIITESNKQRERLKGLLEEINERDDEASAGRTTLNFDYSLGNQLESALRQIDEGIGELNECITEYADR